VQLDEYTQEKASNKNTSIAEFSNSLSRTYELAFICPFPSSISILRTWDYWVTKNKL